MRLIFMGTPDFAATTLAALVGTGHKVVCVYAQPPRPAGRGYELRKSAVQLSAESFGIEVRTPASLKSPEEHTNFQLLQADAAIVVAYGLLLPEPILASPKYRCFNVHASLLPRWRGAAPVQRAIMAGDAETGITIMRMEAGLDTGPMMKVVRHPITLETTAGSLHDELANIGARAMLDVLKSPDAPAVPQPTHGVTYARKIDKDETHIDFTLGANEVRNHIHGLSPFPGAWFAVKGLRIKALRAQISAHSGQAGVFVNDTLTIACGTGAIQLQTLQREGKGIMGAETFLRGISIPAGTLAT